MSQAESHVTPQFYDSGQQREAVTQGMWLFLVQEIMFFGGLFLVYLVYRHWYPEAFQAASHHLDVRLGALNTAVLLLSSFTMVMAVRCTEIRRRVATAVFLVLTALLGILFLVVKGFEYSHKFHEHLWPGGHFVWHGPEVVGHVKMFYNIYFAMTGMHALHMIIGVVLVLLLVPRTLRGEFNGGYNLPVDMLGLYWHFVDLVWIFLFPLLYLLGRS